MVDNDPEAEYYCTDGYQRYLDAAYPGRHICNIHNKKDTFTVESVNASRHHDIPTLAREADVFRESRRTCKLFLFRFTTFSDRRKTAVPVILGLLSLFHFLTSFVALARRPPAQPVRIKKL